MVGHLLGAAGAVEAIATIQVNVALFEASHNLEYLFLWTLGPSLHYLAQGNQYIVDPLS